MGYTNIGIEPVGCVGCSYVGIESVGCVGCSYVGIELVSYVGYSSVGIEPVSCLDRSCVGVTQGSVFGQLLYLLYVSDLPLGINIDSKLVCNADDTSILISGPDIQEVQSESLIAPDSINKWCMTNGLALDLKKTKIITFESNQRNNASFKITCRNEPLQEEMNGKFLGLEINNHMNCKTLIEFILPKLNSMCYMIRCLIHFSTFRTLKMEYYAYFHSAVMYGMICWGNLIESNKVFLHRKSIVRTILGINPWSTCRPHFKTLGIVTVPSQCTLS
jgi:hypothetical protein